MRDDQVRLEAVERELREATSPTEIVRLRARRDVLREGIFNKLLHPRTPKLRKGGGQFAEKALPVGRFDNELAEPGWDPQSKYKRGRFGRKGKWVPKDAPYTPENPAPGAVKPMSVPETGGLSRKPMNAYSPEQQKAIKYAFSANVAGLSLERQADLRSAMETTSKPVTLYRLYRDKPAAHGISSWTDREEVSAAFASPGTQKEARVFPAGTSMLPMPPDFFASEREVLVDERSLPKRRLKEALDGLEEEAFGYFDQAAHMLKRTGQSLSFDEKKHPREPKRRKGGGRFASKPGRATPPTGKKQMPLRDKLISELTQMDERDRKRTKGLRTKGYNPYALAIMFGSVQDNFDPAIAAGASPEDAFMEAFTPTRGTHGVAKKLGLALDVDRGQWVKTEGRANPPTGPVPAGSRPGTPTSSEIRKWNAELAARRETPRAKKLRARQDDAIARARALAPDDPDYQRAFDKTERSMGRKTPSLPSGVKRPAGRLVDLDQGSKYKGYTIEKVEGDKWGIAEDKSRVFGSPEAVRRYIDGPTARSYQPGGEAAARGTRGQGVKPGRKNPPKAPRLGSKEALGMKGRSTYASRAAGMSDDQLQDEIARASDFGPKPRLDAAVAEEDRRKAKPKPKFPRKVQPYYGKD